MTDTPTHALFASVADRTVSGRLFSWGEESRLSVSGEAPVAFGVGTLGIPRDVTALNATIMHDRYKPAARFTAIEDDGVGPVAHFKIADSEEGDELLAGIASGRLTRLSAEVANLVRRGRDAVSSMLTGAAFVDEGAFASAALFAIGDITTVLESDPRTLADIAADIAALGDPATVLTDLAEALATMTTSGTPEATQEKKEDIVTDVIIPDGVSTETPEKKPDTSLGALFAAVSYAKRSGDQSVLAPFAGGNADFAIGTVQHSGPTSLTIGADTQEPAYLGELWKRRGYVRKYWGLVQNAPLTSYKVVGWRFTTEPTVAAYAGNVAEIPSNAGVDTEPVTADARRIAGGHRLDRRFRDFNDQEVIEAYFRLMTESYSKVSDLDILGRIIASATATAPGAVPSGIPKGLAALVDGALDVIAQDNTPSFAIVSPELWRDILFMAKDDVFAFLNASFGLEEGGLDRFSVIPGAVGTGKVIVGAKEAMTAYELGGSPIRVEGLAPHNGAIDPALYGYIADVTHNAAAIRTVTVA